MSHRLKTIANSLIPSDRRRNALTGTTPASPMVARVVSTRIQNPGSKRRTYKEENEMFARIASMLSIVLILSAPARADEPRTLKVLWCTGGGFHDFKRLTPLLGDSIKKYANVRF